MLTNSITMRLNGTNAKALGWQASALKQGAAVVGLPCPSQLTHAVAGRLLAQEIRARLEGALFGNRRDNQN